MCQKNYISFFCVGIMCLWFIHQNVQAQNRLFKTRKGVEIRPTLTSSINNPDPRPKFVELSYQKINTFPVAIRSEKFGNENKWSQSARDVSAKLNIPVLLKDNLSILVGLRYKNAEFEFNDLNYSDLPAYYKIDDREMTSLGVRLYIKKKFANNWSLTTRLSADLNGDRIEFSNYQKYLRHTYLGLLKKQKNKRTAFGIGIGYGDDLGNKSIYPILAYEHILSNRWKMSLYLPKSMEFRYTVSDKMYITTKAKVSGASYYLANPVLDGYDASEFRYSAVQMSLSLDREIHDWLWVGMKIGGLKTLNMYFSEPEAPRRDRLLRVKSFETSFINFSVYLVPPRKLYKKKL